MRDMGAEMEKDAICIALMKDTSIAREFYSALCNMSWVAVVDLPEDEKIVAKLKGEYKDSWSCSWRYAGGIIADIRNAAYNAGEDYMDWYCSGNEGAVSETVEECLGRMGWRPVYDGDD